MPAYELTNAAAQDFEKIFEFGIEQFGISQALKYQHGLQQQLDEIALYPTRYPAVDTIIQGYRRSIYGSHSIYYHIQEKQIIIVRILGQQDISRAF